MINQISISNFKQIKKLNIALPQGITIFSGLNGTGKSTIISILAKLQQFFLGSLPITELWNFSDIPIWDYNSYGHIMACININLTIDKNKFDYQIVLDRNFKDNSCRIEAESLFYNGSLLFDTSTGEVVISTNDNKLLNFPVDWSISGLEICQRYNYHIAEFRSFYLSKMFFIAPNPFTITGIHARPEQIINLNCNNFSAWYDYWLSITPDRLSSIFSQIREFYPDFIRFSLLDSGNGKQLVAQINESNFALPFVQLSDGQKTLSIIYSIIALAPNDSTIAIDEFENYLSPVELQPLYSIMNEAWEERNIQFLLVSHSPNTLQWFRNNILNFSYKNKISTINNFIYDSEIHLNIIDALQNQE